MKKIYLFITTIIFIISIVSCGSNSDKKNEKENKDKIVNQNDSSDIISSTPYEVKKDEVFNLAYKFNTGDSFKYRLTTTTSTSQNVVADSTIANMFNQKIIQILDFNTISVEHDTIAQLKCTITDIDVNRNIDGKTSSYKAGENPDSTKLNQFMEYAGILNNPFNVKVSTHGRIIDISNTNKLVNKFEKLMKLKKPLTKEEQKTLQNNFEESFLKPMMTQIFREIPDKELKIGSTWNKSVPPSQILGFKFSYNNTFNLDNIEKVKEDRIAEITGKSNITIEGKTKQVDRGVEYNFEKPLVSASGKLFFNIDKGLLYKSATGTNLEFNFSSQMIGPKGLIKANTNRKINNQNVAELL